MTSPRFLTENERLARAEYRYPRLAKIAEPPKKLSTKRRGWSAYWLFWVLGMVLTGFVIPEAHAILNKQDGDTLSENIRLWLHTDTPGGGRKFIAIWVALATVLAWLLPHILQVPGTPLTG